MDLKKVKKIAKALADDNRLQILQRIQKKSNCLACMDISEFINLSQPSISHHVKQLADAELITCEKEGRYVKYQINQGVLDEFIDFLGCLKKS